MNLQDFSLAPKPCGTPRPPYPPTILRICLTMLGMIVKSNHPSSPAATGFPPIFDTPLKFHIAPWNWELEVYFPVGMAKFQEARLNLQDSSFFHPGPRSVHIPQFDIKISATSGQNGAEMIKTYLTSVKNHAEVTTGVCVCVLFQKQIT